MGSPARLGAMALAVPFVLTLGVAFTAGASGATSPAAAPVTACGTSPVQVGQPVDGITLGPGQLSNARIIYDVSVTMRLPQRAAVIAEATAMQESGLVNLPDGTSDSLGLFQQRPSQGWGTPAQIMQPVYASTRFYEALDRRPRLAVAAAHRRRPGRPRLGHPGRVREVGISRRLPGRHVQRER